LVLLRRPTAFSLVIILLWAARAEAAKVVIVRSGAVSPEVNETLSRLQGEVLSLGLEVAITERLATVNASQSRAWVERLATEWETDAVIDVIGDAAPAAVDVWVFGRQPRRSEVSRVALEPNTENAAERLAIRAVEALRSRLVEMDLAANIPPAPAATRAPPETVTQGPPRDSGDPIGRLDLEMGAALLTSFDGVGPALMPLVRIGWSARSWLVLEGALAGFGSRPTVTSTVGSARVAQQYAVFGGCTCVRGAGALQPHLAISAGALRTTIDGQADAPADAHFVERWSFLLEGSVGARLRVAGRYHLTLAAHVQVAAPYVAIHFIDTVVATSGNPNLGLSLTVGAWL
jgi:hypothetical protein